MRILNLAFLACLLCIGTASCPYAQEREGTKKFRLPDVPDTLRTPESRAAYLALHYWDHFGFTDTTLISRPEITEQAFVDFISVLPYTPEARAALDTLFHRASAEKRMLRHFISLGDKYLYEPNSPMCDEGLYILVLRSLTAGPYLDEHEKSRPRYRLEMALKNRPGDMAEDFTVMCRDGRRRSLSDIKADHILLYFNDPDCGNCRQVKERLAAVTRPLEPGLLKVFSVCVEGRTAAWEKAVFPDSWIDGYDEEGRLTRGRVYDLKAMPTLYLLDAEKRVVLKDASVERIEAWIRKQGDE